VDVSVNELKKCSKCEEVLVIESPLVEQVKCRVCGTENMLADNRPNQQTMISSSTQELPEEPEFQSTSELPTSEGDDTKLSEPGETVATPFRSDSTFKRNAIPDDWDPRVLERIVLGGKYRIDRHIGSGAMGDVFEGRHVDLDSRVAIKTLGFKLSNDQEFVERFLYEGKTVARIEHEHIVKIQDIGKEKVEIADEELRVYYMVLNYIEGPDGAPLSLAQYIENKDRLGGKISIDETIRLGIEIACGLDEVHTKNIFHRDIKPANILINKERHAKVADFGVATTRHLNRGQTMGTSGDVVGTLLYMAPEQRADSTTVDARSDVFSLGVVLYEMLNGPIPMEVTEVRKETCKMPCKRRSDIDGFSSRRMDRIIKKAIHQDPDKRYQTMGDLIFDLEALRDTRLERGENPVRRKLITWSLISVITLFLTGLAILYVPALREQMPKPVTDILCKFFGPCVNVDELIEAITANDLQRANEILDQSPDLVNEKSRSQGVTPLYRSLEKTLLDQASTQQFEMVSLLLRGGADVDLIGSDLTGDAALHFAVKHGDLELVTWLCVKDADILRKNRDGHTPLSLAGLREDKAIVNFLKGRIKPGEHQKWLPAAIVAEDLELIEELLQRGANLDMEADALKDKVREQSVSFLEGLLPHISQKLLEELIQEARSAKAHRSLEVLLKHQRKDWVKVIVNQPDEEGNADLHQAAKDGDGERCLLLLEAGAEPAARNNKGERPEDLARGEAKTIFNEFEILEIIREGRVQEFNELVGKDPRILKKRLKAGSLVHLIARANHPDMLDAYMTHHQKGLEEKTEQGFTPLRVAVDEGNLETIRKLAQLGVDRSSEDNEGVSIAEAALKQKMAADILSILFEEGKDGDKLVPGKSLLIKAIRALDERLVELILRYIPDEDFREVQFVEDVLRETIFQPLNPRLFVLVRGNVPDKVICDDKATFRKLQDLAADHAHVTAANDLIPPCELIIPLGVKKINEIEVNVLDREDARKNLDSPGAGQPELGLPEQFRWAERATRLAEAIDVQLAELNKEKFPAPSVKNELQKLIDQPILTERARTDICNRIKRIVKKEKWPGKWPEE